MSGLMVQHKKFLDIFKVKKWLKIISDERTKNAKNSPMDEKEI